jgi:ribonuclease I
MQKDWPSYKNCAHLLVAITRPACCAHVAAPSNVAPVAHAADFCFYTHEWDCHGSCSGLSQADYFSRVIALHEQYPIMVRAAV